MLEMEKAPDDAIPSGASKRDLRGSTTDIQGKTPGEKPQDAPRVVKTYDTEVEQWLIGSILCDNRLLDDVAPILKPEHWYDPMHRRFYDAMLHAKEHGIEILDPFTLEKLVGDDPGLRECKISGRNYFINCATGAPALSNIQKAARDKVKSYAGMLIEHAARRVAIQFVEDINFAVSDAAAQVPVATLMQNFTDAFALVRETAMVGTSHRIQLVGFDDIKLGTTRRDLVKGLIPRSGLTLVWGPPKCGKSFWAYDLSMHIALGWTYRGRQVQPGAVIYCAFEGQSGFEKRAAVFRQEFLADHHEPIPFYLMPLRLDLVGDHAELIAAIKRTLPDGAPVLVVLDTLNRSIRGSESSDEDMTAYVDAADAIREAFDCAVIIVHHCGYDETRARGFSGLPGAVSAQIAVKRDTNDNIVAELELMRDGPTGDQIVSRLKIVEVGMDEDGDTLMSCVVVPGEAVAKTAKSATLTAAEMGWYRDLVALFAEPEATEMTVPTSGMPQVRTLTREQVRAGFKHKGRFTLEPDGALTGSDREKMRAYLCALKDKGKICMTDKFVWLLPERQ